MSVESLDARVCEMCEQAAEELEEAYARIDEDMDALEEYAEWFQGIIQRLADLQYPVFVCAKRMAGGAIDDRVASAALSACEAVLALDHIPHEGHIRSIIWIRLVLGPQIEILDWEDWPFDISTYISEDEEDASA